MARNATRLWLNRSRKLCPSGTTPVAERGCRARRDREAGLIDNQGMLFQNGVRCIPPAPLKQITTPYTLTSLPTTTFHLPSPFFLANLFALFSVKHCLTFIIFL